jgi:hypothetical protein
MTVFIVGTKHQNNDPSLKAKINQEFPNDNYEVGRGLWLVGFKGTARQLYDRLFPTDEPSGVTVFRTSGYWGIAPQDMWEWLATETKKEEPS